MKKIILILSITFSSNCLFSQDKDAVAKMHYISAEDFFNKQTPADFEACILELDKAEQALGNTNSKILYLKIKAMYEFALANDDNYYKYDIESNLQMFFKITDSKNYPAEKYNEIIKISELFKEKMNTAYQTALQKNSILGYEAYLKEFPSGTNATNAKRKKNALTERKNYIDSIFTSAYKSTFAEIKKNKYFASSFSKGNLDTLITFNNGGFVSSDIFVLVYTQNNRPNPSFNKDSLFSYLNLYINYKLKVFDALEKDYDKTEEFENELSGYAVKLLNDSVPFNISNDKIPEMLDKYKALISQYYEGILLFNITDREVWTKAVKDTVGFQMFYDKNKKKYHGSLEATKGIVTADFQNYLEAQWISQLKEKYKPIVNERVLKALKKP